MNQPDSTSDTYLRAAFDAANDAIFVMDLYEDKVVDANLRVAELLGYDSREHLLDGVFAELRLMDEPAIKAALRKAQSGEPQIFEWKVRHIDGTLIPTEVSLRVQTVNNQRLAIFILRTISEQKNAKPIGLEELFDLKELQRIQDDFSAATGVASIITHTDGTPITQPSNFTKLCYDIIRKTEKGCANCFKSDAALGQFKKNGPRAQRCLSGGLWDAGASIEIGGKHIGNWLIGQVRDEAQTDEAMRDYAIKIGADEAEFMAAFQDVPVMNQERFNAIAGALYTLARQLSTMAFQNMQQARFIAERKENEQALQQSENQYRLLFENMPSGFALNEVIVDQQGSVYDVRFLQVNPAFETLTGLSADHVIGRRATDVLPATESYWIDPLGEVLRSNRPTSFETYSQALDKYYSIGIFPAGPKRCAVIFSDITERIVAETSLKESEQRFRGMLENAAQLAVQSYDSGGIIHYWNKGSEVTYGYTAEEAVGKNIMDLIIPPEMRAFVAEAIQRGAETGAMPATQEYTLLRKDGTRVPVLTSHAVHHLPGQVHELFRLDVEISAQKKAENQLRKLNEIQTLILDNSTLGIALISHRNFEWVNPRLSELFQIPREQLKGSTRILYDSDEEFEQIGPRIYDELRQGYRFDRDVKFQRHNGSVFWCRLIGKSLDPAHAEEGSIWMFEDITDRKETELKIADLARFPEENTNPVIRISSDGVLLYTNPAGVDLSGAGDQEIGTPVSEKWAMFVHEALVALQSTEIELQMEEAIFAVTVVPVATRDYVNIYARNITERILAQKEMDESRRLLRSIIDTIPVRVFWKDRNSVYLGGNKAFAEDAGIANTDDLSGKTDYDICWTEKRARTVRAQERDIINSGQPMLNLEEHLKHSDGSDRWIRSSKVPLRDKEGAVTGLLGVYEEITQGKEVEHELLRLSTAIEQSPESVVITDPTGCIQYINPAFTETTGYSRTEALGRNPKLLSSGEHHTSFYAELWKTIQSGEIWEGRFTNRRKDGTTFMEEASISPVKDSDGLITNYVAVKRDITEELKREEELRQSQKMEAVGQLAGGIAHDFNNILQAVLGFSEILMMRLEEDSLEHRNVQEIYKSAQRAAALISQLLAFSRKQPAAQVRLDLNNSILDDEVLLAMLLGERYEIDLRLSNNLPMIHADHSQMTQVLMNLAVNARDAMPNGGRLTITTDTAVSSDNKVNTFICLSVSDTGCGMTKEIKARLFDPFFTTKNVGEGTGLGLSVVYGIVQQNRGWIEVETQINAGTTFKIYLPIAPNPSSTQNESAAGKGADRMTILLVEDDRQVLDMVTRVLEESDYCTQGFENAEEALAVYKNNPNAFDMLLTDICLPDQNGIELADTIRLITPSLPVLVYSGDSEQKQHLESLHKKHYHFIEKPLSVTALLAAMNKTLARSH
jgi:PAS domain S-box-containing protein